MRLSNRKTLVGYTWFLNHEKLTPRSMMKYLGFPLFNNHSKFQYCHYLSENVRSQVSMMKKADHTFGKYSFRPVLHFYNSKVLPKITYGLELYPGWMMEELHKMESLIWKSILYCLPKSVPIVTIRYELGLHSLSSIVQWR